MKCDVEPSAFLWAMGQEGHILRATVTFVLQSSKTRATLTKHGYLNENVDGFNGWISHKMLGYRGIWRKAMKTSIEDIETNCHLNFLQIVVRRDEHLHSTRLHTSTRAMALACLSCNLSFRAAKVRLPSILTSTMWSLSGQTIFARYCGIKRSKESS